MTYEGRTQGYEFTRDLCRAIELFTADEVRLNPGAFDYRGLDLRYAVERQLYIACVNSASLAEFHAGAIRADSIPAGMDRMSVLVAPFLMLEPAIVPRRITGHGRVYLGLRWLYGQLRQAATGARRIRTPRPVGREVLFQIGHPKFARYLAPLTRRIDKSRYAYLVTVDPALAEPLTAASEPVMIWPASRNSLRAATKTGPLQDFPGLLHAADISRAALTDLKPRCVVVVEGNSPLDSVTSEVCRLLGIPSYCIQQGWSPYVHTGFRNLAFTRMFVWGERFAEILKPFNPRQSFVVSGSHALSGDAARPEAPSMRRVISFFLQAPCAFLPTGGYDAFVALIVASAIAHPDVTFVVREHPGYPVPAVQRQALTALKNVVFSDPVREPLADVISASELVVSVFSTVLLEALAFGVVPLVCSIGELPQYAPDIAGAGAGIEVYSVKAAREVIDAVISEPSMLAPYRDTVRLLAGQYFSKQDAAGLLVEHIWGGDSDPSQNKKS